MPPAVMPDRGCAFEVDNHSAAGGVDTAVKDYLKAYSTWAYTKQAMDHWAEGLRKALDRWHGKATLEK